MATAEVVKTVTEVTLTLELAEAEDLKALLGRQTRGDLFEAYAALEKVLRDL